MIDSEATASEYCHIFVFCPVLFPVFLWQTVSHSDIQTAEKYSVKNFAVKSFVVKNKVARLAKLEKTNYVCLQSTGL